MDNKDIADELIEGDLYEAISTAEDAFDVHYCIMKVLEKADEIKER